jgi:hypothetical protein
MLGSTSLPVQGMSVATSVTDFACLPYRARLIDVSPSLDGADPLQGRRAYSLLSASRCLTTQHLIGHVELMIRT